MKLQAQKDRGRYLFSLVAILTILVIMGIMSLVTTEARAETEEKLFYTVQVNSSTGIDGAVRIFNQLSAAISDQTVDPMVASPEVFASLRVEHISPYYTTRIGKFDDRNSAVILADSLNDIFPKTTILHAYIRPERIVKSAGLELDFTLPPATAEEIVTIMPAAGPAAPLETVDEPSPAVEPPEPDLIAARIDAHIQTDAVGTEPAPTVEAAAVEPVATIEPPPAATPAPVSEPVAAVPPPAGPPAEAAAPPPLTRDAAEPQAPIIERSNTFRYIILTLLVLLAIYLYYAYTKKSATGSAVTPDQFERPGLQKTLKLSDALETRLIRNLKEVSLFEGNILDVDKDIKTIYVTSCLNGEGKTTAALNIAYSLAKNSNTRILLVDGNSDAPRLHKLFGAAAAPGLCDTMRSEDFNSDILKQTEYGNLFIITHGGKTAGKHSSAETEKMIKALLDKLRDQFDYIIFDGLSLLSSSEPAILANSFDGIVMVVESERTKWEVAQLGIEKLIKLKGNMLGVVLNKRKYYIPRFLYGKV
ncbi:MAG: CpsD/CapB family tyrosine-protein kinase [Desulfobacterales bacterium]|nr:CpsD/CapB family tyrosine-protein kinase [Desulfobacterales bacterium]